MFVSKLINTYKLEIVFFVNGQTLGGILSGIAILGKRPLVKVQFTKIAITSMNVSVLREDFFHRENVCRTTLDHAPLAILVPLKLGKNVVVWQYHFDSEPNRIRFSF